MSSRQCEIAAESYSASLLAQCGYDVLVQYGANQPDYDLIAVKNERILKISVKGTQRPGWMLAAKFKNSDISYHEAIDLWCKGQKDDTVFLFINFLGVNIGGSPRAYLAKRKEIANHMKKQCNGRGHGALQEDIKFHQPKTKYDHKLPDDWIFSKNRIDSI